MADSTSKAEKDLATLKSTVTTISTLITQLQTTASSTDAKGVEKDSNVNALDLAHDTASLIKAHSTKLSLLIINKPFTATAITTVLRELISGPLPGLASSIEICNAVKYTKAMSEELQWRAKKLFTELGALITAIPLDGKVLNEEQKNGSLAEGKGSLAATGTVWEACDKIMELKTMGVGGLCIKKAEEYRDLVKDALEELQEWGEEESSDNEDEDDEAAGSADEEGAGISAQDAVDEMFASQHHIPSADPEKIRPRLESSLKRIRLVALMYAAVIKRRFKTLPYLPHPSLPPELKAKSDEDPGIVSCLDEVLDLLKKIPDITDELANAFYELDSQEIDKRMSECFFTAFSAVQLLITNWEGQKDEFSTWVSRRLLGT
jgi:hypothetical protein